MLDDRRSLGVGRALALWIALLAGIVVWSLVVFTTPKSRAEPQVPEWSSSHTVASTSAETALETAVPVDLRTTVGEPVGAVDTKPQPIMQRGSIHGYVRVVGEGAPASLDGFARIAAVTESAKDDLASYVGLPVVRIAKEGEFTFGSVPPGEWIVSVEPDGCDKAQARAVVSETTPHPWVEITTYPAKPHELTVVLLDGHGSQLAMPFEAVKPRVGGGFTPSFFDRFPRVGAKVQEGRLYPTLDTVRSDEPGAWVVAKFPRACSGFAAVELGGYVVDSVPFAKGQSVVTLRVDASRLAAVQADVEVRVIDAATGWPLSDATVLLGPEQPFYKAELSSLRPRTELDIEASTNDRGVAKFASAPVGNVEVLVKRTGFVAEHRVLELKPGLNPTCEFALARGFTIRGTLEQLDSGVVTVSASRMEDADSMRLVSTSKCDSDGKFTLTGLPAGEYAIGQAFALGTGVIRGLAGPVRAGRVPGYAFVDLRNGDVSGVLIPRMAVTTRTIKLGESTDR